MWWRKKNKMEERNKMYGNVKEEKVTEEGNSIYGHKVEDDNKPVVFRKGNVKLVMFTNKDTGISSFKFEKFYKPKPKEGESLKDVEFKTTNYLNENDLYKVLACVHKYYNVLVYTENKEKLN